MDKWVKLVFGSGATLGLSYKVLKGNLLDPEIKVLPAGTLSQTLKLADFSAFLRLTVASSKCYQWIQWHKDTKANILSRTTKMISLTWMKVHVGSKALLQQNPRVTTKGAG